MWRRRLDWRPRDLSWRIAVLFMIGASCFALGSVPLYFQNVNPGIVGMTFFVGSVFFTSASYSQYYQTINAVGAGGSQHRFFAWQPSERLWWATAVQFVGTLFFNVTTFRGMWVTDPAEVNQLVWAPDFFGSVAFLIASHFAWLAVCGRVWCVDRGDRDWWVAALNYVGSIFFMFAAIASFTLPTTGEMVNIVIVNAGTFLGAVCFFLGAYLLLDPVGSSDARIGTT